MTSYDVSHLERMLAAVARYQRGDLRLRTLIDTLAASIDALEPGEPAWLQDLRDGWTTLEVTYAVAADRGNGRLSDQDRAVVSGAVERLRSLTKGVLEARLERTPTEQRVYAHLHKADDEGRLILTCFGTHRDLERLGIELREGLEIAFWMDDADDHGDPDPLHFEGVVHYDREHQRWVAEIDWEQVRNASDEA